MRILICTTQVPFTCGGAEAHVAGLQRALIEAGHQAETVALPFKWYPPSEIMRSAMAWRMLDLSAANGQSIDLVLGMKFPAYLVAHPNKVHPRSERGVRQCTDRRRSFEAIQQPGQRSPLSSAPSARSFASRRAARL